MAPVREVCVGTSGPLVREENVADGLLDRSPTAQAEGETGEGQSYLSSGYGLVVH